MTAERHVILGLATPRSPWFTEVARWATSGAIAAEFVKCISAEELRVRLTSGRSFSCLLVDAASGAVDRDLLGTAEAREVPVLVVTDGDDQRWRDLGATAVLPTALTRDLLLDALGHHSVPLDRAETLPVEVAPLPDPDATCPHPLVAVTGRPGAGSSTTAIALAQGLASEGRDVVLADTRLDADQAVLHDARDVIPGLQELVEAARRGPISDEAVRALTFSVTARSYHLLLGLRRHRDWTVLRRDALVHGLGGLRSAFEVVVADVGCDVEGEAETGAVEVEERNLLARTVLGQADLVLTLGRSDLAGLHGLVQVVARLRGLGVASERILTVLTRAPRRPRRRAELTRAVAELTADPLLPAVLGPLHLVDRDGLDLALRDGTRLPSGLCRSTARAVTEVLAGLAAGPEPPAEPVRVRAGSLGLTEVVVEA